nr:hypothetical protein [Tanacetum cinerariifolium]
MRSPCAAAACHSGNWPWSSRSCRPVAPATSRGQLLLRLNTDLLRMQIRDALAERLKAESAVHTLESWADGEEMARARRALSSSQLGLVDTHRKLAETQGLLEQGIVPRIEVDSLEQQLNTQR